MRSMASAPARVMMIAMTMASRGRSTKTPLIIGSALPAGGCGSRPGSRWAGRLPGLGRVHRLAGADPLQPFGDHRLAVLQAIFHHHLVAHGTAEPDRAALRLLILGDQQHKGAA